MLVLIETWAGFALFKVLDEGKLSEIEVITIHLSSTSYSSSSFTRLSTDHRVASQNLSQDFTTPDAARKVIFLYFVIFVSNIDETYVEVEIETYMYR